MPRAQTNDAFRAMEVVGKLISSRIFGDGVLHNSPEYMACREVLLTYGIPVHESISSATEVKRLVLEGHSADDLIAAAVLIFQ